MEKIKKGPIAYRVVRALVDAFYPSIELVGAEHLPSGACIIVANHAQMNGPLAGELSFPGKRSIWCAGEMMNLKDVPAYAYRDFWSKKPKLLRPFYRLLSYIIAPLAVLIFKNANTIGVYHDTRIMGTFKETVARLADGARIIIFPEHEKELNNIVYEFQDKFIDVARLYFKRTGEEVLFVPMYIAPKLRSMHLGEPIKFRANENIAEERARICNYLTDKITEIACALPRHTVIPYPNISKKLYPCNKPLEDSNEKTRR